MTESGKVLLHSCCAPCSCAILEWMLSEGIRPVVFFSNSNIAPLEEYELRLSELRRHAGKLGIEVVADEYDHEDWLAHVARGRENEPERGSRCQECFRYRLRRAADYADRNGFSRLTTSLASSRWKNLAQVGMAGEEACQAHPQVQWWDKNWRKGGLQERRNALIKELGFYNQNFCGCEFSRKADSVLLDV